MSWANLSSNLNIDISSFTRGLNRAANSTKAFASTIRGTLNEAIDDPTKKSKALDLSLKSNARIIQGILVSKAFYTVYQDIRNCISAIADFNVELEYSQMIFTNMTGSSSLGQNLINVLEDFAVKTPFSFTEAESAAKRLLAYGIEYKNVMYMMKGVMESSTITGNSATVESVSRALGQIYTKGRLMNEEMRQLAEAGIPAYKILQQQLGVTQKQLQNLGDESIPASTAINALLTGISELYGGVADQASQTMRGMISNIKDTALLLAEELTIPITSKFRAIISNIVNSFTAMYKTISTEGIGGLFESLVPESLQGPLKTLIANITVLYRSLSLLHSVNLSIVKSLLPVLVSWLNTILSVINPVINIIANMSAVLYTNSTYLGILKSALMTAAAAWVVFKARALAALVVSALASTINVVTVALSRLANALTFIVAHPALGIFLALSGIILYLTGTFDKAREAVNGLLNSFTSFQGVDADKLLLPSQKERTSDLNAFNNALDDTADNMEDVADSATKANKGLLSFDEAFRLTDSSGSVDDEANTLDIPQMNLTDTSTWMPSVATFTQWGKDFAAHLKEALLLDNVVGSAIGSALGMAIGGIIGGPAGAKIGAIIGGIAGWFWKDLANAFGLTDTEAVVVPIAATIGALLGKAVTLALGTGAIGGIALGATIAGFVGRLGALVYEGFSSGSFDVGGISFTIAEGLATAFGFLVGGVGGSLIGAALAVLGEFVYNKCFEIIGEKFGTVDEQKLSNIVNGIGQAFINVGTRLGTTITIALKEGLKIDWDSFLTGGLKSGLTGFFVGVATGLLSDLLYSWIGSELDKTEQDLKNSSIGQTIGGIAGSIIGGIIGAFFAGVGAVPGSMIGNALGTLIGGGIGLFASNISDWWMTSMAPFFTKTVPDSIYRFGNAVNNVLIAFSDKVFGGIQGAFEEIRTFLIGISDFLYTAFISTADAISTIFSDVIGKVSKVFNDVVSAISTVVTTIGGVLLNFVGLIGDIFIYAFTVVKNRLTDIFGPIVSTIRDALSLVFVVISANIKQGIETVTTFFTNIYNIVYEKISSIVQTISDVWGLVYTVISSYMTLAYDAVSTVFTNIYNVVSEKVNAVIKAVTDVWSVVYTVIATNMQMAATAVSTAFSNLYNGLVAKITKILDAITNTFNLIKNTISSIITTAVDFVVTKFDTLASLLGTSLSAAYDVVSTWISDIYSTCTSWITDLWDNVFGKFFQWLDDGITKLREFFQAKTDAENGKTTTSVTPSTTVTTGHAIGGVFDKEHIARFAEGNKREAIIPLENESAMQPFSNAVAQGVAAVLGPIIANINGGNGGNGNSQLRPLYVGTLVADERGLKELSKKMQVIEIQENTRRGL